MYIIIPLGKSRKYKDSMMVLIISVQFNEAVSNTVSTNFSEIIRKIADIVYVINIINAKIDCLIG